jgi:hypothetical protein
MSKDTHPRQQQDFNPILDIITQCLSCVTSGSVRVVDVDNQTAIEIDGYSKGKSDISINIEEHGDRLRLVNEVDKEKVGILDRLSNARQFADSLASNDVTLSVLYKGKEVMMLGKSAKPKLN